MAADGRISFETDLDSSALMKKLKKLNEEINKIEKKNAKLYSKRSDLLSKSSESGAKLDEAKAKLAEMQGNKKAFSSDAIKEQKAEVALLQAEFNKINSAVERTDRSLADGTSRLKELKEEAGATQRELGKRNVADVFTKEIPAKIGKVVSSVKKGTTGLFSFLNSGVKSITGKFKSVFSIFSNSAKKAAGKAASSFKRIAPALLAVRGVIGILRKAVSAYMEQNQEVSQRMQNAWAGLGSALGPIINKIVSLVATAISYLTKFLALIGITGKTASSQISSAGGAASKETKKLQRQLASFDELNVLNGKDDDSGGGGGSAGYQTEDVNLPDFATLMAEQITSGKWEDAAKTLTGALNDMVAKVDWNGVGAKIGKALDNAMSFLSTTITTFDWYSLGADLGEGISSFMEEVDWSNLGVLLAAKFKVLIDGLGGFFASFDWEELGNSAAEAFSGFWDSIDWEQAATTLNDGVIGALEGISTAIKNIDWQKIGNDVAIFLSEINWDGILEAISDGIGAALGGLAAFIWGVISDAWEDVVEWWNETAYKDGEFFWEGLRDGIINALKNIGKWINDHIFTPFINGFREAFGIHSPSKVMAEQGGFLISGLFNGLKDSWESVKKWFKDTVSGIEKIFSNAWTSIKKTTASLWSGIANAVKGPINKLIGFVNTMISNLISGLNFLIGKMNAISFTAPTWVPLIGGKTIGVNIPYIAEKQIPYLAKGAVIPPNREFMAVLGDQKHGTNIEAPLETIQEAVALVMEDNISAMMAGFEALLQENQRLRSAVEGIEVGDSTIGRAANRYNQRMAIQRGV